MFLIYTQTKFFQQDDAVLTVHPNTSNIIGRMGELSLMQIRPDANTTLRIGGNDGQPSTFSGTADAEIDVTSGSLGIEVMSNTNSIFAESNRSEALIRTNKTEVCLFSFCTYRAEKNY